MNDHERIFLQPDCCADPDTGRLWCEDPSPEDCDQGTPWTEYVRRDIFEERERYILKLECALRQVAEEPNIDRAREIADGILESNAELSGAGTGAATEPGRSPASDLSA